MKNFDKIIKKFKHQTPIYVRYGDLDTFKHVNNMQYLAYLEEARISYLENITGFEKKTLAFNSVVAKIIITYHIPIKIEDKIIAYTRCSRIGNKSLDIEVFLIKENTQEISAKSLATLVSVDMKTGLSVQNNQKNIELIKEFEKSL